MSMIINQAGDQAMLIHVMNCGGGVLLLCLLLREKRYNTAILYNNSVVFQHLLCSRNRHYPACIDNQVDSLHVADYTVGNAEKPTLCE